MLTVPLSQLGLALACTSLCRLKQNVRDFNNGKGEVIV